MEMPFDETILFTKSENKVYFTLLSLGSSPAGPIIRESGLYSSVVYRALEKLIKKGFVKSVNMHNKRHYEAVDPKSLIDVLANEENKLKDALPLLMALKSKGKEGHDIYMYEGFNGAKHVFNDMLSVLKPGDEQLVIGASRSSMPLYDFLKNWNKKREKMRIGKRIILFSNAREFISDYKKQKLTKIKILPSRFESPMAIDIYGDKTSIMLWGDYPIEIVIENAKITYSFKQYFKFMWSFADRIR